MTYIALLRAINVGGRNVSMERLREAFAALGLRNVRTYIQTGNVFFESDETDRQALAERIGRGLKESLGYEVPAMLRTVPEFDAILAAQPFDRVEVTPEIRLCLAFGPGPLPSLPLPMVSPKGDMELLAAAGDTVFCVLRVAEPGKVGNIAAFIEKVCGTPVTVRFYGTSLKILEAARK